MGNILTIDQSTFSTKVFIMDSEGRILDDESIKHQQIYPHTGWVEHDPEEIYENLLECVRRIKNRNTSFINDVEGISITNQRETVLLWNHITQRPIYNAIVWQCRRTVKQCEQLSNHNYLVEKLTGLRVDPYFSATKIKWILDHTQAKIEEIKVGTMESWLIYKLSEGKSHVSDVTNASRTLLMNIHNLRWDESLCQLFGVPQSILPTIKENSDIFGTSNISGLLSKFVPILGVIGDSQAALYAQHCFNKGDMKVTLGTGTSILMNVGNQCGTNKKGIITALGWRLNGHTTYANEAIINCSGDTLNWLKNQLQLFEKEEELNDIFNQTKENDGVYLVPAFAGLSVPWWSLDAKASITGLQRNHSKKHIIRSGLESIAYQIYDATKALDYNKKRTICIDGGASSNEGLIQFISDILEAKITISKQPNLSARGSFEIANRMINNNTHILYEQLHYFPMMEQNMRLKNIEGWHKAVSSVLTMCHKKEEDTHE